MSRTAEARKEPPRGECVRYHPRANWSKAAALNGLANAERVRGRLAEAAKLYGQALDAWKETSGADGATASVTGLGLVRHGQGRYAEALELHRRALTSRVRILPIAPPSSTTSAAPSLPSARRTRRARLSRRPSGSTAGCATGGRGDRPQQPRGGRGDAIGSRQACASYADALAASRDADDRRGAAITTRHLKRLVEGGETGDRALDRCRAALSVP